MRAVLTGCSTFIVARRFAPGQQHRPAAPRHGGGCLGAQSACAARRPGSIGCTSPTYKFGTLGQLFSRCHGDGKRTAATAAQTGSGGSDLWLLVGLGNPGSQYEDNRHNVRKQTEDDGFSSHSVTLLTGQVSHNAC